jgi:hypothetical protein
MIILAMLFGCSTFMLAQDSPGRFELGGSLTAVRNFNFPSELGVGLESDLNLGRHFAVDAALDWLPSNGPEGNTVIGLFGAKAGVRKQHFGYFAKVRPGFVTIDTVFREENLVDSPSSNVVRFARLTQGALDLGGVVEYYPAQHWALRWDLGDMLIFQNEGPLFVDTLNGQTSSFRQFPSKVTNNFRFSTGLHYRF